MPIAAFIPAIIGGGVALAGGAMQSRAASQQAGAVSDAADQSAATQRYIFDQTRADNSVRQGAGDAATRQMMALMGLGGQQAPQDPYQPQINPGPGGYQPSTPTPNPMSGGQAGGQQAFSPLMDTENAFGGRGNALSQPKVGGAQYSIDPMAPQTLPGVPESGQAGGQTGGQTGNALSDPTAWLRSTPGYDFNFNEGIRSLNTGLAGLGRLQSGDAQREAIRYGQNYGDRIYGDQYNRLAGMAGMGQTASSQSQAAGSNYANAMTNINQNQANGLASSYQNSANAWTNALGGVAGAGLWAYGKG